MRTAATLALVSALALAGCETSGFKVATEANTARVNSYQDNLLLQAENDLTAINGCYLRAAGYIVKSSSGAPVAAGGGFLELLKVGEPTSSEGCTVMATALRTQSNMLTAFAPFMGQALMSRVPAAPEEILQSLAEKGMQFSLMKYGVEAVTKVVASGQLAQTQIAQSGITAASKPPLVVDKPVVVQVPMGSSVVPTAPVPATP